MKKIIAIVAVLFVVPLAASAHETQIFEINGKTYQFVVGSLNEPLSVDDKSGVDLRITDLGHVDETMEEGGHGHDAGEAVAGLEESLKVELIAGDKKKTLDISPVYNTPGAYKAPFYPTVATTLSYRVFGTLNDTPVDLTFTCNTAGHGDAKEDTARTPVSDDVVRIKKTGAFGCPTPKADMGFPEPSSDILTLQKEGEDGMATWGALAVSLIALAFVLTRRKS